MNRILIVSDEGEPRDPTEKELKEVAISFLFGMCVEELHRLGASDEDIEELLEDALNCLERRTAVS